MNKFFTKECKECYGEGVIIEGAFDAWGCDAFESECPKCKGKREITYELPF
jgi:DnaJ-class molecular chaperone